MGVWQYGYISTWVYGSMGISKSVDRVTSYTVEPLYSGHCVGRPPAYSSQWIGSQAIQWNLSIVVTV